MTEKDFGILLEQVASHGNLYEFLTEYIEEAEKSDIPDVSKTRLSAMESVVK